MKRLALLASLVIALLVSPVNVNAKSGGGSGRHFNPADHPRGPDGRFVKKGTGTTGAEHSEHSERSDPQLPADPKPPTTQPATQPVVVDHPELTDELQQAKAELAAAKKTFDPQLVAAVEYKDAKAKLEKATTAMDDARRVAGQDALTIAATAKLQAQATLDAVVKKLQSADPTIAAAEAKVALIYQKIRLAKS
jgi:hypothetical protein